VKPFLSTKFWSKFGNENQFIIISFGSKNILERMLKGGIIPKNDPPFQDFFLQVKVPKDFAFPLKNATLKQNIRGIIELNMFYNEEEIRIRQKEKKNNSINRYKTNK
jgi:hypothetical protein